MRAQHYNAEIDKTLRKWTGIASMVTGRYNACVGVIGGKIYVCGGSDGSTALKTCEMYDPKTKTWTSIASMATGRHGACVGVVVGKIYVFGGNDGSTRLKTWE